MQFQILFLIPCIRGLALERRSAIARLDNGAFVDVSILVAAGVRGEPPACFAYFVTRQSRAPVAALERRPAAPPRLEITGAFVKNSFLLFSNS